MIYAAFAVIVAGIALAWMWRHTLGLGWQSRHWSQTEGKITEHLSYHEFVRGLSIHTLTPSSGVIVGRVCRYSYEVDGKSYESTRYNADGSKWGDASYQALPDIGSTIIISYDPQDPSVSLVKPGLSAVSLIILLLIGIGSVFLALLLFTDMQARLEAKAPRSFPGPTFDQKP